MFPIGDENRGARGVPVVTVTLVVINVLVYLYEASLKPFHHNVWRDPG